jgi:hypothetical protein
MPRPSGSPARSEMMNTLSRLLLSPRRQDENFSATAAALRKIHREDFDTLSDLAHTNHVIMRGMEVFRELMLDAQDSERAEWASEAISAERARIQTAVSFLRAICTVFAQEGLDVTVIKSLDHWPDLGSDLDLYTNAKPERVCAMMQTRFSASIAARSWGDRLAGKWNFIVPGLPEPVEVHMQRLGQTGEQRVVASQLPGRARRFEVEGLPFWVPSASDRLMISTLQRMYRHFYFRLCDVVDSADLVSSGQVDFNDLMRSAQAAGIWEGVATYLVIVSDYVRKYNGQGLALPKFVTDTARFGGDVINFGRDFLGLLPWLATAAAVGQKITGSDKGIW